MSDLLTRIDAATAGVCPCGAQPREGSIYCGPDCEPTHISDDTDDRDAGPLATPMRWRPDLVTAADDSDLIPLGSQTYYSGRYNAQMFDRRGRRDVWHLRLDDGCRFVGCDLDDVGDIDDDLIRRVGEKWAALERELANTRHLVEDDDPWADVMRRSFPDPVADLLELSRAHRGAVRTLVELSNAGDHVHIHVDRALYHRPSYHNPHVQAAVLAASGVEDAMRQVGQGIRSMAPAVEAFLRQVGMELTDWQRNVVEQMYSTRVVAPRMTGRQIAGVAFRPLVNRRDAAVLREHGYREGEHFEVYATPPASEPAACGHDALDEPPTDPMERALWLRRRRNTGPGPDRLDGRRGRRR